MLTFVTAVWMACQPGGTTITSVKTKIYEADRLYLHKYNDFIFTGCYSPITGDISGEFGNLLEGTVTNDIFRKHLTVDNGYIYPLEYPGESGLSPEELGVLEEVCGKWN